MDSDMAAGFSLSRYNSITITYTGTPVVSVLVDGTTKISTTTLSSPSGVQDVATLYFPAMTEGVIPHVTATETEANRIIRYSYDAEEI